MRLAQQRRLKARFPQVFRKLTPDGYQRGTPVGERTIECGPGWYALVAELAHTLERQIQRLPTKERQRVFCVQVKEKFGGLRFYMSSKTPAMAAAIERAVQKSFRICEDCGRAGKVRNRHGWLTTLCTAHEKERLAPTDVDADARARDFSGAMQSAETPRPSLRRGQ
jgi:hypothetical protein